MIPQPGKPHLRNRELASPYAGPALKDRDAGPFSLGSFEREPISQMGFAMFLPGLVPTVRALEGGVSIPGLDLTRHWQE